MKEKRLYLKSENENFKGRTSSRQVIKEINFSDDKRDFGYIADNIPCQQACPVHVNIPGYIRCIWEQRYGRAYELNRMYNILPGVLGRICSRPCEKKCRHGEVDLGESVSICDLKRSAADYKLKGHRIKESLFSPSGKTVAIVGSGPAGLGAAHELAILGHRVVIYEAMESLGGMLRYGIPEFRLPRDILDIETNNIMRLGVESYTGVQIGNDLPLNDLLRAHDAVILTIGCMKPNRLNIEGEDLQGVYSGLDFMMKVNRGERPETGNKVAVIGDGFTAMDCSRISRRLGARKVTVNTRMTEEYMPIDDHEKNEVKSEDIHIYSLVNIKKIIGNGSRVKAVVFERTKLEFSTEFPGRKAVIIENSEFTMPVDTVISAIGQHSDPIKLGVKLKMKGAGIWTDNVTGRTNIKGLYAAGDCATGSANVISAIARGRNAAYEVDRMFEGRRRKIQVVRFEPAEQTDRKRDYDFIPAVKAATISTDLRIKSPVKEVEIGFSNEEASTEASRCYLCYLKYEIDINRCIYCFACIDVAPRDCIKMIEGVDIKEDGTYGDYTETKEWKNVAAIAIDNKRCIRCGKCYEVCPMNCIHITKVELVEQGLEG